MNARPSAASLNLRAGDVVEVRSLEEILATLDDRARFEALPFMPEMLKFTGRQFRVSARADRTCDRVERTGIRTMTGAVHLDGVRCDGALHDGCDAACLIYWKEAWLKRVDRKAVEPPPQNPDDAPLMPVAAPHAARIFEATKHTQTDGERVYSCQATAGLDYTCAVLPDQKHSYWRDVRCGNVRWHEALRAHLVERFNAFQQRRGGTQYPPLQGSLSTTPAERLDLQPGDFVQVRPRDEIVGTLDVEGRNRGLTFDREMLMYCGGTYRVLKRVDRIIDERSGRMIPMKRDCIILDGVVCKSRYHGLCQRAIFAFWREIWLRRASAYRPVRPIRGEGSFAVFVVLSALKMVARRWSGVRVAR